VENQKESIEQMNGLAPIQDFELEDSSQEGEEEKQSPTRVRIVDGSELKHIDWDNPV